jgi:GcrA cell cycle regulator
MSFPRSSAPIRQPHISLPAAEQQPRLVHGKFVTTATLTSRTCKWPIGDPAEADFHYCGHPPRAGGPYCQMHDEKSYGRGRTR